MLYGKFFKYYMLFQWLKKQNRQIVENIRLKYLRKMVRYALQHSIFYKELYHEAGIKETDVEQITLNDLPYTNKKLLMDRFDQVVTDQRLKFNELMKELEKNKGNSFCYLDKYEIMETSGTSGLIGIFPILIENLQIVMAVIESFIVSPASFLLKNWRRPRFVNYLVVGPRAGTVLSKHSKIDAFVDTHLLSLANSLDETIQQLNTLQPDWLMGYASAIKSLAEEQLAGRLKISPSFILCGADPLHDTTRQMIKNAYHVDPVDMYASTENLFIGYRQHTPYFIVLDPLCYIEKESITNLYNYTFPLIRYQTDDLIDFIDDYDETPFTKVSLHTLRGSDELLVTDNQGKTVALKAHLLGCFTVDGLTAFQFCKKGDDSILVKVTGHGNGLEERVKQAMIELLALHNAYPSVHVEVRVVKNIPVDPRTHKQRRIIADYEEEELTGT